MQVFVVIINVMPIADDASWKHSQPIKTSQFWAV